MEWLILQLNSIKDLFHQHTLLSLGILLFSGYFLGKLFNLIKLPAITGYILAGLLLGPSVSGIINKETGHSFSGITEIALSLIALTIGGEFSFAKIRQIGLKIFVLTLFEAIFAFIFVSVSMQLAGLKAPIAFLLGAISAATAPAATVIIIRELRARGKFVDYLYGIVAFDDAVSVILFGVIFSVSTPLLTGLLPDGGYLGSILNSLLKLLISAAIGIFGGLLIHLLTIKKFRINEIMLISISFLFLVTAITKAFGLSPLIANIAMGAAIINFSLKNKRVFSILEPLTPPIFALFFILAGTELDITVLTSGSVVLLGLVYIGSRFSGKIAGIQLGGLLMSTEKKIRNNLGFCLFPQAGVAIGLALFVRTSPVIHSATTDIKAMMSLIVNIVLFSVFVNELIGPIISRYGIKKGTGI